MSSLNRIGLSTEAIRFQGQTLFYKELTLAFQNAIGATHKDQDVITSSDRSGNVNMSTYQTYTFNKNDALQLSKTLETLIKKHVNMTVVVKITDWENAAAEPPVFTATNPMAQSFAEYGRFAHDYFNNKSADLLKQIRGATSDIDLERGRLDGAFSKIPFNLFIGHALWGRLRLNAEEMAAVTLHELGHLFTFLEYVTRGVTANFAITAASDQLAGMEDLTQRIEIIEAAANALDVKIDNVEELAKVKSKSGVETVLAKKFMEKYMPSATGSSRYDLSASEFSADQFAVRQGAGKALITALDHMNTMWGNDSYKHGKGFHILSEAIKWIWGIIMTIGLMGIPLIFVGMVLVWGSYEDRLYDTPAERFDRIRRDLVQSLKNPKLSKHQREEIIADLDVIDKIISGYTDRRSLMNLIWQSLHPRRKKAYNDRIFQQELEKIINNDIFVNANRLSILSSTK